MKCLINILFTILLLATSCNTSPNPIKEKATDTPKLNTGPTIAKPSEKKEELTNCGEIVMEILTTSKKFKELTNGLGEAVVKNGGTSYGIDFEGSPNPQQDSALAYSNTYDFSLHETYPDHNPVIARFTFDNKAKQLYQYNSLLDTLEPIEFNKKILLGLDSSCK